MKISTYCKWAVLVITCFIARNPSLAQCGSIPSSGLVTISSAGFVINSYYNGTGNPTAGTTSLTLGTRDARGASNPIAGGDFIVIMQMQGADINTNNTNVYGSGVAGPPTSGYLSTNLVAGYYEYATVSTVVGSVVTLTSSLAKNYYTRAYTSSNAIQAYQVIRVPRYFNLTVNSGASITAPAWNGSTGGVVVIDAAGTFTLNGSVTVAALGFRGGGGKQLAGASATLSSNGTTTLVNTDYRYNSPITNANNTAGGAKGEGIAGTPAYLYVNGATTTATAAVEGYLSGSMGRGAPGNAGGGGTDGQPVNQNQSNTGGGGGGNGGAGGQGGSGWPAGNGTQDSSTYPFGGYGGAVFTQASLQRIIMGGGAGAGTANNSDATNEVNVSGGTGGGIIVSRANLYAGSGSVNADGGDGPGVTTTYATAQTDAAGGGGAGGTIVLVTVGNGTTGLGTITASAKGGTGGNMSTYYNHGPGGGGGGGIIYTNGTLSSSNVTGGSNGFTRVGSTGGALTNYYNARPGSNGRLVTLSGAPIFSCGVLPIILRFFSATLQGGAVYLNWGVESAENFSFFSIEYSTDGTHFSDLGTMGFTPGTTDYKYVHTNPQAGLNYYRIRMVDDNGKYIYTNILLINLRENPVAALQLYPNPSPNQVTLQFTSDKDQQIDVQVIDNAGKPLIHKSFDTQRGRNFMLIPETAYLAAGMYLVKVRAGSAIYTQKLLKAK